LIDTGELAAVGPGFSDLFCKILIYSFFCRSFVAEPLEDEDLDLKEDYIKQGFPEWSRRDFQQLIRGMETYGWCVLNSLFSFLFWSF